MATPNLYATPMRNSVPLPTAISSENGIYHINSRGSADLFSPQGLDISVSEGGDTMGIHDAESRACHESGSTEGPPSIDTYDVVDIADVQIDMSLSRAERMKSYIRQIKDPYRFRCNGIVVTVAFADTDATIEDRLEEYICQRQANNHKIHEGR